MKIKSGEVIDLLTGLSSLDGYERVVKDGSNEKVMREFYTLKGGLRLTIAKNMNCLQVLAKAIRDARNGLIREHADGGDRVPPGKMVEYGEQERVLLDTEHEVDLETIRLSELSLDKNPIPVSVIALISPLLEDDS